MTIPQWEKYPSGLKLSLVDGALGILIFGQQEFTVCIQGIWDPKRYSSLDDAKEAGITILRKFMQDANHQLDLLRIQTPLSEHFGRTAK